MAFIAPGLVSIGFAAVVAMALVADPSDAELLPPGSPARSSLAEPIRRPSEEDDPVPLSIILRIPGLVPYCCACFFSKLSYYAFVFWLPYYLDHALNYDQTKAGIFSTFFDWGGFVGGIVGGVICDRLKLRGIVLLAFQAMAVPMLILYWSLGKQGQLGDTSNQVVLLALGFTITTPYNLITALMSTDLGRHPSLQGNSKACATVTAILDGTGSCGAVLQGVVVSWTSRLFGWSAIFLLLMVFSTFSAACLIQPACKELREKNRTVPPREVDQLRATPGSR
jgi:sugar phosphate permease